MGTTSPRPEEHHHDSLPSLLRRQARAHRGRVAVCGAEGDLTFGELRDAADRIGSHLVGLGVRPDTCVGLFAEPSADVVTGVWGILTAGAAYLPLSPDYPDSRLRYMADDAGVRVVVTQPHLRGRLRGLVSEGTVVVTARAAMAAAGRHPLPEVRGEHLAYVIHTSGSSGSPKGVMIEHRSIVAQVRWLERNGHIGPQVSVLQKTPISFDAAQWEILAAAAGTRVVMSTPGMFRDPQGIVALIRERGVTALQAVPTLLRALADTDGFAACTTLTRVFSGGEALTRSLAQDLYRALPGISLVNLYGPTETTINAASLRIDPDALGDSCPFLLPRATSNPPTR
ncbi:AMP-binding protein [Streptomyces zhihengii]